MDRLFSRQIFLTHLSFDTIKNMKYHIWIKKRVCRLDIDFYLKVGPSPVS